MSILYSQTTNSLPLKQKIEIVKGLKQGENLRDAVNRLQAQLDAANDIIRKDSISLADKDKIIFLLEKSAESKDKRIVLGDTQSEIEKALLKDKWKKRFSVGFSIGTTVKDFTTWEMRPYIGFGINYRLFKF